MNVNYTKSQNTVHLYRHRQRIVNDEFKRVVIYNYYCLVVSLGFITLMNNGTSQGDFRQQSISLSCSRGILFHPKIPIIKYPNDLKSVSIMGSS